MPLNSNKLIVIDLFDRVSILSRNIFQEVQNEKQKFWFELNVFLQEVSSDEAGSILGSPMDRSETATTRGGTSQKTLDQLKKRRKSHSLLSVPPGGVMTRNNTESSTSISVKEWGHLVIYAIFVLLFYVISWALRTWCDISSLSLFIA